MKHWLWLTVPALLLLAPWALPSPVNPEKPRTGKGSIVLPAHSAQLTLVACKGSERTVAIVAPADEEVRKQRLGLLGLYVYDPHGNCIARDEYVARGPGSDRRPASDDAAVEWFPPITQTYTVELRNQGGEPTIVQMAIR